MSVSIPVAPAPKLARLKEWLANVNAAWALEIG
jgi:hypothetical protein